MPRIRFLNVKTTWAGALSHPKIERETDSKRQTTLKRELFINLNRSKLQWVTKLLEKSSKKGLHRMGDFDTLCLVFSAFSSIG